MSHPLKAENGRDAIMALLKARKDELLSAHNASAPERRPVELDQSRVGRLSRMDALQAQAMSQALDKRRETEIRRIDAALARLDEGEYGYCTACGADIDLKRLELDPAAPLCADCAN